MFIQQGARSKNTSNNSSPLSSDRIPVKLNNLMEMNALSAAKGDEIVNQNNSNQKNTFIPQLVSSNQFAIAKYNNDYPSYLENNVYDVRMDSIIDIKFDVSNNYNPRYNQTLQVAKNSSTLYSTRQTISAREHNGLNSTINQRNHSPLRTV